MCCVQSFNVFLLLFFLLFPLLLCKINTIAEIIFVFKISITDYWSYVEIVNQSYVVISEICLPNHMFAYVVFFISMMIFVSFYNMGRKK